MEFLGICVVMVGLSEHPIVHTQTVVVLPIMMNNSGILDCVVAGLGSFHALKSHLP